MTPADIAAQAHRIMVEQPVCVRMVIVAPVTAHELQQQMWLDVTRADRPPIRTPALHEPGPVGLEMVIDHDLPPNVWRLADEHGTLLYDCRQGQVVP